MKVIVAGSRSITNYNLIKSYLDDFAEEFFLSEVVSGGASGVDRLGERWSLESGHGQAKIFPYDTSKGKFGGFSRNNEMAEYADMLIAFWDGESRGTKHMIHRMLQLGKSVFVVHLETKKEEHYEGQTRARSFLRGHKA